MPGHTERRVVAHDADHLYALVADVDSYSEFLPWCVASRVTSRKPTSDGTGEVIEADLIVAFKLFREKFTSRVTLYPATRRIEVEYLDGPFTRLENRWIFTDLGAERCEVDFLVDFDIRNRFLDQLVGSLFQRAMERIVGAFEGRADALGDAAQKGVKHATPSRTGTGIGPETAAS